MDRLVAGICFTACKQKQGHFLYYCPAQKQYRAATKKLEKLGFQKIYNFFHLDFLNREPDKGVAEMWSLQIYPADVMDLKAL
jgi:hypothetical protein